MSSRMAHVQQDKNGHWKVNNLLSPAGTWLQTKCCQMVAVNARRKSVPAAVKRTKWNAVTQATVLTPYINSTEAETVTPAWSQPQGHGDFKGRPLTIRCHGDRTGVKSCTEFMDSMVHMHSRERTWKMVQINTRKKVLAEGEACMAIFYPAPGFKGKASPTEGTLISVSAVLHCRKASILFFWHPVNQYSYVRAKHIL